MAAAHRMTAAHSPWRKARHLMQRSVALQTLQALCLLAAVHCKHVEIDILLPDFHVSKPDTYICGAVSLPPRAHKLIGVMPRAKMNVVHHILLYGCESPKVMPVGNQTSVWDCGESSICATGAPIIMYGWGRDAPDLHLPEGVGFSVGRQTSIRYVVAQVHFLEIRPPGDHSGVTLELKPSSVPLAAGLISFVRAFQLAPGEAAHRVPNKCCYRGHQPLHPFAVRVHTHALGKSVYLERELYNHTGKERVLERSPQLPQAFVPVQHNVIWPGDHLEATCVFDTRNATGVVYAGSKHTDEMCNLYLMVYAPLPYLIQCDNGNFAISDTSPGAMPRAGRLVLDPSPFWKPPANKPQVVQETLGDAVSVTTAPDGAIWTLHRAGRNWDENTFDPTDHIRTNETLAQDVVVKMDPDTGMIMTQWGSGQLLMPHMITVDRDDNVWVVDVGRHQVLKYDNDGNLLMQLGKKQKPGKGKDKFCKPTQVAIANDGTIYVADGYCNQRVVIFNKDGKYLGEARNGHMSVVHSVLLDECDQRLWVASRETRQVIAFDMHTRKMVETIDLSSHGERVWALRRGPYDSTLALVYDVGKVAKIVDIDFNHAWELPGTEQLSPHDFALGAAPVELTGAGERLFAIYLANCGVACPQGCGPLQKYVLSPPGFAMPNAQLLAQEPQSSAYEALYAAADAQIRQEEKDALDKQALSQEQAKVKANADGTKDAAQSDGAKDGLHPADLKEEVEEEPAPVPSKFRAGTKSGKLVADDEDELETGKAESEEDYKSDPDKAYDPQDDMDAPRTPGTIEDDEDGDEEVLLVGALSDPDNMRKVHERQSHGWGHFALQLFGFALLAAIIVPFAMFVMRTYVSISRNTLAARYAGVPSVEDMLEASEALERVEHGSGRSNGAGGIGSRVARGTGGRGAAAALGRGLGKMLGLSGGPSYSKVDAQASELGLSESNFLVKGMAISRSSNQ